MFFVFLGMGVGVTVRVTYPLFQSSQLVFGRHTTNHQQLPAMTVTNYQNSMAPSGGVKTGIKKIDWETQANDVFKGMTE